MRITLPWSALISKNRPKNEQRKRWEQRYHAAIRAARAEALKQVAPPRPRFAGLVELYAVVHPPDDRQRDPLNYSAAICDALQGVVYADDAQIDESRWKRGGVDPENPRAELVVQPLTNASADC